MVTTRCCDRKSSRLIFCFHILLPIFNRKRQFHAIIIGINKNISPNKSSSEIRLFILETIKKCIPWGFDSFQEYKEAWSSSRVGDDEKACSPIRIRDFLTSEIVLDKIRNQRLANAIPGIFVSIGIFGTFLGLVLGLAEINPEEVEDMAKGVKSLIAGLSLAFSSSLLGILFSILFSFFYKVFISQLENTFFLFDESIGKFFPYHSSERFSGQYLETQIDIKHSMQTLATDIVTKLGPKIGEAIGAELNPLRYDFSLLLEKLQQNNSETSKGLVELFDNKFKEIFKELSMIIKETTLVQSQIKDQMENFAESLQKNFKGQVELIEKTSRAGQILSDSLESLESISVQLKLSADHVVSAAILLEESSGKSKEGHEILRETMEKQISTLTKTREDLTASWENITDNTEGVVELMRLTIGELQEGVGTNLLKALESFVERSRCAAEKKL
jgi:biopolymer transport protein ExbB/TolQ